MSGVSTGAVDSPLEFAGRSVVVTGAASGIGKAAAQLFARRGAGVLLADIDPAGAAVAADLAAQGASAAFQLVDVTDPEACERMVESAQARFGPLAAAFNNAGIGQDFAPTANLSLAEWRRVIDVDLSGVFYCLRAELPALLAAGGGAIVNTASVAGCVSFPNLAAYVAAKHGVIGLTKAVCNEYAAQGVRCNVIVPGFIETPLFEPIAAAPGARETLRSLTPANRIGTPEEVAEAAVWLCSAAASYVNGAALAVDGGFLVR